MTEKEESSIQESVRQYYGSVLKCKADLKTSACCAGDALPAYVRPLLDQVPDEIQDTFYGCGFPVPPGLNGANVLDLGSGSGRDVYLIAQLVGPTGHVSGVDMTEEQLAIARKYSDFFQKQCGYDQSNVSFHHGFIEDLQAAGVASQSMDVVVSNCVINLSPRKDTVFSEVHRVLKQGGEFYFSDVFASRRISKDLATDSVLLGECLGGALYLEDFRRLMAHSGFQHFEVVSRQAIQIEDESIAERLQGIDFYSMTIRAFALNLEDRPEDYGHELCYHGGLESCPDTFVFSETQRFEKGKKYRVSGNTARIFQESRYAPYVEVIGNFSKHLGLFEPKKKPSALSVAPASCC